MEQQCAAGLAERQIAQLIENHQIDVHQLVGDLALFADGLLLLPGIGQLDGREVAHTLAVALYGFDSDR